jgi:hypothetical protein
MVRTGKRRQLHRSFPLIRHPGRSEAKIRDRGAGAFPSGPNRISNGLGGSPVPARATLGRDDDGEVFPEKRPPTATFLSPSSVIPDAAKRRSGIGAPGPFHLVPTEMAAGSEATRTRLALRLAGMTTERSFLKRGRQRHLSFSPHPSSQAERRSGFGETRVFVKKGRQKAPFSFPEIAVLGGDENVALC